MPIADEKEYRDKTFKCPFCLRPILDLEDFDTPFGATMEGGKCACGAVYASDYSAKNQGEIFMDTLAFAFDWDFDAAINAEEGAYEEVVVRFNPKVAKYLLGEGERRDRSPRYYFVRRSDKD